MNTRDHLLQCGNKTDQCPNCRLFIRRAVFAYYYENNCANLDESYRSNRFNNSSSNLNRTTQSVLLDKRKFSFLLLKYLYYLILFFL
jgi:hypothetical protein